MLSDFMDGIIEWEKGADDESIIFNGEEAVPYFSSERKCKFAILKDGQFIDSIYMVSKHHTIWVDYVDVSKIDRKEIFRVMGLRAELRKMGWIDERPYDECENIIHTSTLSDPMGECESELFDRNYYSFERDHIILLAIEAYQLYLNSFSPKKSFRSKMEHCSKSFCPEDVMRLALYIALINPALGRGWRYAYNKQGAREQPYSQSYLDITLDYMGFQQTYLQSYKESMACYDGPNKSVVSNELGEWSEKEMAALSIVVSAFERDKNYYVKVNKVQIDAVQLVKAKLTSMGILCSTNVVEQEWVQFVAAAWGVTPSQVVSAAKALKKRESQEQK